MSKIEYYTSWKLADLKGKFILNEEMNEKGARLYYGFDKASDALAWYEMNKGRPLYETITYPCKLFCDIDRKTDIDAIIRAVRNKFAFADPIIQTKDKGDGTHIVFDNTTADSPEDLREAFKNCEVDMSVYGSNRCLRMPLSPKFGKPEKGVYSGRDYGLISRGTEVPETRNAPIKRAVTVKETREMTTLSRVFSNVFGENVEVYGSDPDEVNFEIRVDGICPKCSRIHESLTLRQFVKIGKSTGKVWYRCPRSTSSRPIFVGKVELPS